MYRCIVLFALLPPSRSWGSSAEEEPIVEEARLHFLTQTLPTAREESQHPMPHLTTRLVPRHDAFGDIYVTTRRGVRTTEAEAEPLQFPYDSPRERESLWGDSIVRVLALEGLYRSQWFQYKNNGAVISQRFSKTPETMDNRRRRCIRTSPSNL